MSTDETEMNLMFKDLEADEHFFSTPIDILAWSFGAHTNVKENKLAIPKIQNLSMTKYMSELTPLFYKFIANQRVFETVVFESTNVNQSIKFLLHDVVITTVASGGSAGENRLTENIHLDFKNIEIIYKDHMKENSKAVNSGSIENRNPLGSSRH